MESEGKRIWSQTDLDALEEKRRQVIEHLRAMGAPVDAWMAEASEAQEEALPSKPARKPMTQPPRLLGSTKGLIPEGFQEFRPHPRWGHPVRRCLAKKPWRADGQCAFFALRGSPYCSKHSGGFAKKAGTGTGAHFFKHGRQTRALRKARSEAFALMRMMDEISIGLGLAVPSIRGPRTQSLAKYWEKRAENIRTIRNRFEKELKSSQRLVDQLVKLGFITDADISAEVSLKGKPCSSTTETDHDDEA